MDTFSLPERAAMAAESPGVCAALPWHVLDDAAHVVHTSTRVAHFATAVSTALVGALLAGVLFCLALHRVPAPEPPARLGMSLWLTWLRSPSLQCLCALLLLKLVCIELTLHSVRYGLTRLTALLTPLDGSAPLAKMHLDAQLDTFVQTANDVLQQAQARANAALFGWLTRLVPETTAVLNAVLDTVNDTIRTFLSGTPLRDPVAQFANCLLGHKVAAAERALAWLQAHAAVRFPAVQLRVPDLPALAPAVSLRAVVSRLEHDWAREAAELRSERWCALGVLCGALVALAVLAAMLGRRAEPAACKT